MFEIDFDVDQLIRKAEAIGASADQMPYAFSRALNMAMDDARDHLVNVTWPQHVTVRNEQFIRRLLTIKYSDKHDLEAEIFENKGAVRGDAHLKLHDQGGVKTAKGQFAIPTRNVTITSYGPRADQKPSHLQKKVVIGNTLYAVMGRKHHTKLVPMYRLAKTVNQPADVPFTSDFYQVISGRIDAYFMPALALAMATAR
jgi:hypothetical protein